MDQDKNLTLQPLITEAEIKDRVNEIVKAIANDFKGDELVVVGLLKGSFMFLSDLVRLLHSQNIPLLIDFMIVSSYESKTESSGRIRLIRDITTDIKDRWVLLVDDILDTGRTLDFVVKYLLKKKPAVLKTCVFLDKPARRVVPVRVDYTGFSIPDAFVVGYGLDYDSRYREMPYISIFSSGTSTPCCP
jgi:hypoxanthine phosphoribosyltransferase